jgi:hypothetical protein
LWPVVWLLARGTCNHGSSYGMISACCSFHDKPRSASFWDPDHFIAQIALGGLHREYCFESSCPWS